MVSGLHQCPYHGGSDHIHRTIMDDFSASEPMNVALPGEHRKSLCSRMGTWRISQTQVFVWHERPPPDARDVGAGGPRPVGRHGPGPTRWPGRVAGRPSVALPLHWRIPRHRRRSAVSVPMKRLAQKGWGPHSASGPLTVRPRQGTRGTVPRPGHGAVRPRAAGPWACEGPGAYGTNRAGPSWKGI